MGYYRTRYGIQLGRERYPRIVSLIISTLSSHDTPNCRDTDSFSYLAPVLRTVGITDPLTITALNAALAAWNMICSLGFGSQSERIGRRPMWIISNAGMGFGFCFIMGFAAAFANTGNQAMGIAVIPFIFIVYGELLTGRSRSAMLNIQDFMISLVSVTFINCVVGTDHKGFVLIIRE